MIAWLLFGFVVGLASVVLLLPATQAFFDWLDRRWKQQMDNDLIERDRQNWEKQR